MENDKIKRMIFCEDLRTECQRLLRAQELSAYCEFMSAMRMSGALDGPKRKIIESIRNWFHIPESRHKAEVRRVASDERMEVIADTLSGDLTTQGWIEEGYCETIAATCMIKPIITQQELVEQIVERRLRQCGVVDEDVKVKDEKKDINSTGFAEDDPILKAAKLLKQDECFIPSIKPEIKTEMTKFSLLQFACNLEEEDSAVNRDLSPDITTLSAAARKSLSLNNLKSRLGHTNRHDMRRARLKAQRARALVHKAVGRGRGRGRGRGGRKGQIPSSVPDVTSEDDRQAREVSVASSCFAPIDLPNSYNATLPTNPIPTPRSTRGLSRVRGRTQTTTRGAGRGRGRGRGRPSLSLANENTTQLSSEVPEGFPQPPSEDISPAIVTKPKIRRTPKKSKAKGDESSNVTTKRKKTNFQTQFSVDRNFNETSPDVLKDTQQKQMSPHEAQFQIQGKHSSPVDQMFHRENQFYDTYNPEMRHGHGQGHSYTPPNFTSRTPYIPQHQYLEPPSKNRQKTKHTIIIEDPHESIPGTPKNAVYSDHNESNLRYSIPSSTTAPSSFSSVIVRAPVYPTPPASSPIKIINPGGIPRTQVNIAPNSKIIGNHNSPSKGYHESPHHFPLHSASFNSPIISNNTTPKKRTQNLAATATYTPQPDYYSNSYSSNSTTNPDFTQSSQLLNQSTGPISSVPGTIPTSAATASSLAGRIRPNSYEIKSTLPAPPSAPSSTLPPASSTVNRFFQPLPAPPSPVTGVHQRKVQPHILAASKLHRSSANAISNVPTSSQGNAATPLTPTTSLNSTIPTTATSVAVNVPALPSLQTPVSTLQKPNLTTATSTVVGTEKAVPALPPTTTTAGARTPSANIIFVQKSSPNVLPGPVISTPAGQSPGGIVRAPGKAVILRRANNSNLMILEVQKNQTAAANSSSSQLAQTNKHLNSLAIAKLGKPASGNTPLSQSSNKVTYTTPEMPKVSTPFSATMPTVISASAKPTGFPPSLTSGAGLSTSVQTKDFNSSFTQNQNRTELSIRQDAPSAASAKLSSELNPAAVTTSANNPHQLQVQNTSNTSEITVPSSQNHESETGNDFSRKHTGINTSLNSNNSSTDTASEGDLANSLLSNEVLENSPLAAEVEDEDSGTPGQEYGGYESTVYPSKSKISIVNTISDMDLLSDGVSSNCLPASYFPDSQQQQFPNEISSQRDVSGASEGEYYDKESGESNVSSTYMSARANSTNSMSSQMSESSAGTNRYDEHEECSDEDREEEGEDTGSAFEEEEIELIDLAGDSESDSSRSRSPKKANPLRNCTTHAVTDQGAGKEIIQTPMDANVQVQPSSTSTEVKTSEPSD